MSDSIDSQLQLLEEESAGGTQRWTEDRIFQIPSSDIMGFSGILLFLIIFQLNPIDGIVGYGWLFEPIFGLQNISQCDNSPCTWRS